MKTHPNNSAPYYKKYILFLSETEVLPALQNSHQRSMDILRNIPEEMGDHRYADGKWSIKEILMHLMDTERIFCYRALRFARKDATPLPGYDHDLYVENSHCADRSMASMIEEYKLVRQNSYKMFHYFTQEVLSYAGSMNGVEITVHHLGLLIAGHEDHHIKVLQQRYLAS